VQQPSPRNYDADDDEYDPLGAFRGMWTSARIIGAFVALALAARWVMS
jgi:LPS O-antigen subunit length determinant protein (WzzB/FepE family)